MEPDYEPRVALAWTADGKRRRGRPRMTWRSTAVKERGWNTAVVVAKDRSRWRELVSGPIPTQLEHVL